VGLRGEPELRGDQDGRQACSGEGAHEVEVGREGGGGGVVLLLMRRMMMTLTVLSH
jgi:hypothetical protein